MGNKNFLKSSLIIAAAATTTFAFLPKVDAASAPSFSGRAQIQTYAWRDSSASPSNSMKGAIFVGTTGESKRLEAVKLKVLNAPAGMQLKYRAHVQREGWQDWVDASQIAGTEGQSKRMEAIEVSVANATGYVVKYRAHVQRVGWTDWVTATNSAAEGKDEPDVFAGTVGQSLRLEAIEVTILSVDENEVEEYKQNAIAELRNTFNAANYTECSKEFNELMEEHIKAIKSDTNKTKENVESALSAAKVALEAVPTDAEVKDELKDLKDDLKDELEEYASGLKVAIRDRRGETYIKVSKIAKALENGIATIDSKKYEEIKEQVDRNAVIDELKFDIYDTTKEYAKELLKELYNNGVANDKDEIMTEKNYNDTLKAIEELPVLNVSSRPGMAQLSAIVTTINGLKMSSLKDIQDIYTKTADEMLTKGTLAKTIADEGDTMNVRTADVTKYGELTKVKEAVSDAKDTIKEARSQKAMQDALATAKESALEAIVAYMNTNIEKGLSEGANTKRLTEGQVTTLRESIRNAKYDKLGDLITEYEAVMAKLAN